MLEELKQEHLLLMVVTQLEILLLLLMDLVTVNRLRAGDFIKFNGHTKVYMVVADVTSSSGAATVTMNTMTTALSDDEAVAYIIFLLQYILQMMFKSLVL